MNNDTKRVLLAEVLAGNTNGLRAYQEKRLATDLNIHLVIDNRQVGGAIEVSYKDGAKKELSPDEFEALPLRVRNWCVTIQDHTEGHRVPAPDEDYHTLIGN